MGFSTQSSGGSGESGNWKGYSLTTNGTPDTEDNTTYDQPVFQTAIVNDGSDDIVFGFGVSTSTKSFTLAAGETLDIDLIYKTLYYKSASASQDFRVLVTW